MRFTIRPSDYLNRLTSSFFHYVAAPGRRRGPGVFVCGTAFHAALLVSTFLTTANSALDPSNATNTTYTKDMGIFCNPERWWLYPNTASLGSPGMTAECFCAAPPRGP
jgi:hypothetical protein